MLKGLRFQKRLRILPGVRANLSKSGVSASIGPRGANLNVGPNGVSTNAGLPGSGLSYRQKVTPRNRSAWIGVAALVAGLAFAGWQNRERIADWLSPEAATIVATAPAAPGAPPAPEAQTVPEMETASRPPKAATPGIRAQAAKMLKPGGAIYVRRAGSVLRQAPKPSAATVQKLDKGAKVTIVMLDGPWTQVRSGETVGWMRTSVLGPKP